MWPFSLVLSQGPKKAPKKNQKNLEDNGEESDSEHFTTQQSSSSSQSWISSHPALVNKKLLPAINYWIALNTPNGAPTNPITIHRALLECGVLAIANTVCFTFVHHKLIIFTNVLKMRTTTLCYFKISVFIAFVLEFCCKNI